ncbi:unnamed protein product [Lota lota]
MEITQEQVVSLLIEGNGKVKNSDLLGWFKRCLDSSDPAEKRQNRELFKRIVNDLAVVKDIDDVKYVVLKTKYRHLLTPSQHGNPPEQRENDESRRPGERSPARRERTEKLGDEVGGGGGWNSAVFQQPLTTSPVSDANSEEHKLHLDGDSAAAAIETPQSHNIPNTRKAYGLPLRAPPTYTKSEIHTLKCTSDDPSKEGDPPLPGTLKGRPPKPPQSRSSPLLRRAAKITNPSQAEPVRDPRFTSTAPLEAAEHQWLVKSAAGQWGQVYGLLLQDSQLVEKRDFMSGFTALHWAAKCGNSDMLAKMIRVSRQRGSDVDVNARTHGGYTPLHIAALHDQEFVLAMLVREFGADARLRDNCGKRAYHYLHRGITGQVRELLGEPRAVRAPEQQQQQEDPRQQQQDREEADLFKGLHSIGRLFQPHAGVGTHRKKPKHRPEIYSLSEDPREESE